MGKVKECQMNIQYIMNVLSSHGEPKAIEALEFVLETLKAEPETITHTINGDVREIVKPSENVRDGATLIPVTECTNGMVDDKGKVIMYGDTIENVQQLNHIMSDLDDHDQLTLVTCDEHGDEQDHYPMAIDVIDNIRLTDDTIVREVQFIQRPNSEPDTRDKQPLVDALIDVIVEDANKGDTTVIDELLLRMPYDVIKYALPEDMWADFEDKE